MVYDKFVTQHSSVDMHDLSSFNVAKVKMFDHSMSPLTKCTMRHLQMQATLVGIPSTVLQKNNIFCSGLLLFH